MRVLYLVSDFVYGIIYYCIGYRRKVVMDNLRRAFPEKSESELIFIAKKFYHNFIDSFIEVIKLVSASESWLHKRFTVDVQVLNELYATARAVRCTWGRNLIDIAKIVYDPGFSKLNRKVFWGEIKYEEYDE
jgi:KDO2-lipid IV(A) lauroyltransferase